jgi:type I restriction enzyme S subunit
MNWPAYPEYEGSGVEWLGQVPATWVVGALKRWISRVESGTSVNAADVPATSDEVGVLKTSCVYSGEFDITENKTVLIEELDRVTCPVRAGTLIVSRMNTPDLVGSAGYVAHSTPGIFLPDRLWQVSFRDLSAKWVGYWSKTRTYRDQLKAMSVGTSSSMHNISQPDYGSLAIAVPPAKDQRAIVTFLDRETAKIDALIGKQEQLIATLREDRAATITHAVTRGLDRRIQTEESGVEWIGEVPAHWTVTRLGRLCRSISDGPHFSPPYVDDGVIFLSARNIKVDRWSLDDARFISEQDYKEFSRRVVPEAGDVLYTKGGTTGIARAVDLTQRFQVWVHVAVLKLRKSLVAPDYLAYALNSSGCYEQSQLYTRGATNQDLGLTRMVRILLALPPRDEQREIVEFLNERCGNIDMLIAKSNQVIKTLREYRSALITDAVTGKIDVREAVA